MKSISFFGNIFVLFLETLPGFLLHLENWFVDKDVAALGWGLFTGGELFKKPEASVTEATWMVEKGSLSKSVYQEYRMRFADRMTFPPVNHVRRDKQLYRPPLTEYMHGVRAPLLTCLTLHPVGRCSSFFQPSSSRPSFILAISSSPASISSMNLIASWRPFNT